MRCLFCKADSSRSRSVEHAIPEALGNRSFVLPAGVVCDGCNNYFAVKVEGPLLKTGSLRQLRARQGVPTKRGASCRCSAASRTSTRTWPPFASTPARWCWPSPR
ncbi:HNH endonuclease [Caulobacter sp. UC70_42]|uniref:HNH endonuclease n=1 Tax=Caulobacter sp. UC70_42 TaxID=3374551 RepID=UPI0037565871